MDFTTAAEFPVAYGTSHFALTHRGHLQAGENLLVLGAAGGVGLTAVEIGKAMGARVIRQQLEFADDAASPRQRPGRHCRGSSDSAATGPDRCSRQIRRDSFPRDEIDGVVAVGEWPRAIASTRRMDIPGSVLQL